MRRKAKIAIVVSIDIILILLSNIFTYLFFHVYVDVTFFFLVMSSVVFIFSYLLLGMFFHIFTKVNRYTNLGEILDIFCTIAISSLILIVVLEFLKDDFSRRYVLLLFLLCTISIESSRLLWRLLMETKTKNRSEKMSEGLKKNAVIIGAGEGGRILLNGLLKSSTNTDIKVLGFIDDHPDRQRTYINGVKVLGRVKDLPEIVMNKQIELIIIAIPSLSNKDLNRMIEVIKPLGIKVSSMPALEEVAQGNLTISRMKEIDIIDLLGRDEVKLNLKQIEGQLIGKILLISGAGGSIGSEICRQVIRFKPAKIILLGHGENSIYLIDKELRLENSETEIIPIIADIQDRQSMFSILKKWQPDIVYHAAAHKHVPLMEFNPMEALKNNVYGSMNLAEASLAADVKNFVMISTDKAVNPPNVMGATKRIAEMIVTGLNSEGNTKFSAVRFGNVLGSRGSVIPVFKEQIAKGGPVTVTDFRMTRYFMTIPEASKLVIQCGALSRGGEIFILDMGNPVKIVDLASKMIKLSGYSEDQIKIIETGIRPGEKLYEELLVDKERVNTQVFEKIFIGKVCGFSLEQVKKFLTTLSSEPDELKQQLIAFANKSNE